MRALGFVFVGLVLLGIGYVAGVVTSPVYSMLDPENGGMFGVLFGSEVTKSIAGDITGNCS